MNYDNDEDVEVMIKYSFIKTNFSLLFQDVILLQA